MAGVSQLVAASVRDVPDFPHAGVMFKDITPVLADATVFRRVISYMTDQIEASGATLVVGIEARGFVLGAPVAVQAGLGFVPMRKPGKLPGATLSQAYDLEYGQAALEMQQDAIPSGSKVAVVDDVLATGGTAAAACQLIERVGAQMCGLHFLIELEALAGRKLLPGRQIDSILLV